VNFSTPKGDVRGQSIKSYELGRRAEAGRWSSLLNIIVSCLYWSHLGPEYAGCIVGFFAVYLPFFINATDNKSCKSLKKLPASNEIPLFTIKNQHKILV
jgi:hypothetical protein